MMPVDNAPFQSCDMVSVEVPGVELRNTSDPDILVETYGSFWIDSTEFALSVAVIHEVIDECEAVSPLPLAPAFLKGLMNYRGVVIPVIDLRILLDFPMKSDGREKNEGRRVAIIENGDKCVGLLFDRSGEVLTAPNTAYVNFRKKGSTVKDIVINGVLKLENGDRIVQILEPYELLGLERVPEADTDAFGSRAPRNLGQRRNCITFQLGHTYCGIDLRFIKEVREMPRVEKSLLSNGFVIGTINANGDIIPVVDFRSFMGNEPAYQFDDVTLTKRKLIVMDTENGPIGLLVFSVDSIIPFFDSDIMPFAKLALPRGNIVRGCLVSENKQLVMLLDHDLLRTEPTLTEPAGTCREVYAKSDVAAKDSEVTRKAERKTFILFSIDNRFAIDTSHVSEVIDRPADLLAPPYALDYVEGIINLRGDLITLINLRVLYRMENRAGTEQKVLIFLQNTQKYGVLVDSVDEIVMTTADHVATDRQSGYSDSIRNACLDVSGVLHFKRPEEGHQSVMIIDTGALVDRCVELAVPDQ